MRSNLLLPLLLLSLLSFSSAEDKVSIVPIESVGSDSPTLAELDSADKDTITENMVPYADSIRKLVQPLNVETYFDQGKLISLDLARRHRDPTTAMLRSMLVPGWGQFYNDKPWKAALAIISETTCIGLTAYNYILMERYRLASEDAYRFYRKAVEAKDQSSAARYKERGDYDDGRYNYFIIEMEKNAWLFAGFAFLSTLDAYIDAHLSDFDVYDLPRDPNVTPIPNPRLTEDPIIPLFSFSITF